MQEVLGPSGGEGGCKKPDMVAEQRILPMPHIEGWVVVLHFFRAPGLGEIRAVLDWVAGGLGLSLREVVLVVSAGRPRLKVNVNQVGRVY